jgi:hypothetical protein
MDAGGADLDTGVEDNVDGCARGRLLPSEFPARSVGHSFFSLLPLTTLVPYRHYEADRSAYGRHAWTYVRVVWTGEGQKLTRSCMQPGSTCVHSGCPSWTRSLRLGVVSEEF